ncbi:MAG: hypothetical protein AMXMBFR64_14320 [Myxococcales bacterium]
MKPVRLFALSVFLLAACPDSGAVVSGGGVDVSDDQVNGPAVSDALILKKLGGDPDGELGALDGGWDGTSDDITVQDAASPDAGALIDAAEDAGGTPDAGPAQDGGPSDGGPVDAGSPLDVALPPDVADVGAPDVAAPDTGPAPGGTAACFALLGATCDKLDQCAGEVPFGGSQFAQYAAQCESIVADPDGQVEDGCAAAKGLDDVTPAEAAACVASFDCGLSGLGALAQALYPVFDAWQKKEDFGGKIPGAVEALLAACK